jgi:glucosyl-3-phosphoglycerate synthase
LDPKTWFSRRTLQHQDFSNIRDLVSQKKRQDLAISVCLPTLNSADALDEILTSIKNALIRNYPLIDELAIIDGGSTDRTVAIAEKHGAKVLYDKDGFSEMPPGRGKGEALWKSVYGLSGDIIAWLDSDIKNFDPRFVYGTVGPLLKDPSIGYIKSFYKRPIRINGALQTEGGGRVTELTARPLLDIFYPDLAYFVQPLSGEYAGRREVLESVPFVTGYGVESALLIDIYNTFGLDAMAQVNLDVRVHDNQPLSALGRMSFGITQTIFTRLIRDGKIAEIADINHTLTAFANDNGLHPVAGDIQLIERPAMKTMSEYVKKFKNRSRKWPSA